MAAQVSQMHTLNNSSKTYSDLNLNAKVKVLVLLVTLLASSLFPASNSLAIQGGESAKGSGFVVGIVIKIGETSGTLCTGGLLAPQLVATAAHCVIKRGVLADKNSILAFPPGAELTSPLSVKVKDIFAPEGYKNQSDSGEPNDIAFLVFDRPLGNVTLGALADQAMVQKIVSSGTKIRLYGYGITGRDQPPAGYPKSILLKPIERLVLQGFEGRENTYINYAQEESGAACNGDSGGPAVAEFNGVLTLVSVHSSSSGICSDASDAVNNWGTIPGEFLSLYSSARKSATEVAISPSPSPSPPPSPTASSSTVIKTRTIKCIKGNKTVKVTAIKPRCPRGYVLKK